jgi:gamma-glutamyltranspeptidase/glutathione hydrolase
MVAGPHPLTAEAGLQVLKIGGNAFDAAVAAAFTEAVVEPAHNGVAGYGGGAVGYHAGEGRVVCVDYNTEAPAAAHAAMFPVEPGPGGFTVPGAVHKYGALSIGVPGTVAGLEEIHRAWGTLPLAALMAPAIRAARDGWTCNGNTHRNLRENAERITRDFPATARLLMPQGQVPQPGERMTNPELAVTLEGLAAGGLRSFYEGGPATRIVEGLRAQGGILEQEDLSGYRARQVDPVRMEYRGRTLHTPPVGCGGITSFQMLRVLEGFDLEERRPGTVPFYHLFAEVMKACWRRRLTTLGDPQFTGVSELGQLDEALIRELRAEVEEGLRHPQPGERIAPEPMNCTSHLCAADAAGNVVSLTQTHGGSFGSLVTVPGTGLTFGHGMARFDPRPEGPNSIAPKKRPFHNMAPVLATRDGRPEAAYGTPGGRTIVNNQAYFSLCMFVFGLEIHEALAAPRLHCEEAEPMNLEERAGDAVLAGLRALGHQVQAVEKNGGPAHGIVLGAGRGEMDGAADPRGEGKVAWE